MNRLMLCCLAMLTFTACESSPSPEPTQAIFGPTKMVRTPAGYQLSNRRRTASIDETTGTVKLYVTDRPNIADGVTPSFSPMADSSPTAGYVESRDEETWQYIGQSKDGRLGWRIVCNLYYDSMNVTVIVQNKTNLPLTGHVQFPAAKHTIIQPFNEDPALNTPAADGSVRSDERTLQPGERISFATRWKMK